MQQSIMREGIRVKRRGRRWPSFFVCIFKDERCDCLLYTSSVDGILKRLQTEYLDILLLHRPDALVEPEEVAEAFEMCIRDRDAYTAAAL